MFGAVFVEVALSGGCRAASTGLELAGVVGRSEAGVWEGVCLVEGMFPGEKRIPTGRQE